LGIYTNRPNVSKLCSFISSMNSSILISVIQENKLLVSVPCFQKICLLSTNDLCFLTITCRPSRSFFLFPFFVLFLYSQNYTRIRTLSLYVTRSIYEPYSCSKIFLAFPNTPAVHTKVSLYTLVAHTHKDFFSHITRKNPSIHIFLLHSYMRNIFLFIYIRRHLFTTLLSFYHVFGSFFLFWTTFLNEKFYTIPELQQNTIDNNEVNTK